MADSDTFQWPEFRLTDVFEVRSGLSKPASEFGTGFPFVTFKDVLDNIFLPDKLGNLVQSTENERTSCSVRRGDVFLTRTSETQEELGMSSVALKNYEGATFNGFTKRLRPKDPSRIVPEYAAYFFRGPHFRQAITGFSSLSTRASLNNEMLNRLVITLPDVKTQKAVGYTLCALDDKIKHNRRTMMALERLARAIFRAWFVDFEPVKAKAEGATAFPSMPQAVYDAMPTRFVDSEIGPVPEGWEVGVIEDILRERKERVSPSDETLRLPYVPIDCITAEQITLEQWKSGGEAKSSLVKFYPSDILFGAMRPYFHKVCLAPFEGTTRTTCFVFTPRVEEDRAFALMLASEVGTVDYATNHSVGSTIPYAKWEGSLALMPCVNPPAELRSAFGELIDTSLDTCQQLVRESQKLAKMRDYLLPKLLSRKARVAADGSGSEAQA